MNSKHYFFRFAILLVLGFSSVGLAQDIETETVLEGLNRPAGIAIRSGDNVVHIAEFGANRIIKIHDGKAIELVAEFPDAQHAMMDSEGGPFSIGFLNPNWLVVGAGQGADQPIQVHAFDLSTIKDAEPLKAENASAKLEIKSGDGLLNGQVNGMVLATADAFVAVGAGEKSIVGKLGSAELPPKEINMLIPANEEEDAWLNSPRAMSVSVPEGYLAFIQDSEKGSVLTFYTEAGEANGQFETGLKNVVAMAYGPTRGRLFLADRETNAIYKLIESDNEAGCESVKVYELTGINDMKFNAAGELFLTTSGETVGDDTGKVIKLVGLDSAVESESDGEE